MMTDDEFNLMLKLVRQYGEGGDMDQFDHFRVGTIYVALGLQPDPACERPDLFYRDLTRFT